MPEVTGTQPADRTTAVTLGEQDGPVPLARRQEIGDGRHAATSKRSS